MGETTAGAASGAASGAKAGMMVGGVWGAVIGAVIGGIFGGKAGKAAKKAHKLEAEANAIDRQQAQMQAGIQRRDLARQARIERAKAIAAGASEAGGLQSSAPMGAISSLGAQTTSALSYFDWQTDLGNTAYNKRAQAAKYLKKAQAIQGYIDMVGGAASMMGSMGGGSTTSSAASSSGTISKSSVGMGTKSSSLSTKTFSTFSKSGI
jgi:uncharacterized membrane protein